MTHIDEVHDLSIAIPVLRSNFFDEKEIEEVFDYAYKLSKIYNFSHYPNKFKRTYECGNDVYKFTISVDHHNVELLPKLKQELEELVDVYNQVEREYLRFRKFGNIESRMIIRKGKMPND